MGFTEETRKALPQERYARGVAAATALDPDLGYLMESMYSLLTQLVSSGYNPANTIAAGATRGRMEAFLEPRETDIPLEPFTIQEACEATGLTDNTVREYIARLVPTRLVGGPRKNRAASYLFVSGLARSNGRPAI